MKSPRFLTLTLLVLAYPFASVFSQVETIRTTAGGGPDNINATAANLLIPSSAAVDRSGNLYFADSQANRIYRVNRANGQLTVIAGSGSSGFSGDGGSALKASLSQPAGVTLDNVGNLFIADYGNNRIRRVDVASGLITTVAGGGVCSFICILGDGNLATRALLDGPRGIAVDSSGNLFIADTFNNRVRKVTVGTGIITTLAGSGVFGGVGGFGGDGGPAVLAALDQPNGIALDVAGNVYVADTNNNRVRRIHGLTRVIATVAGTGPAGFGGDGGAAVAATLSAPSGLAIDGVGNIFVADSNNGRIREIAGGTGIISTVAGNGCTTSGQGVCSLGDDGSATNAYLSNPIGIAVDDLGNQFIPDEGNGRIRQVDAGSGNITTFAGSGTGDGGLATLASFFSPGSVAGDSAGDLFIAERGRIRRVDAATRIITTISQSGQRVAVDNAGNLFIADSNSVWRIDANTGAVTTSFQGLVFGIAVGLAGDLYVVDQYDNCVWLVKAGTQTAIRVAGTGNFADNNSFGDGGPAVSAHLYHPSAAAVDTLGNLFIADTSNQRIRRVDVATGVITTVAGTGVKNFSGDGGLATSATLADPLGVYVDGAGNLFIADSLNHRIRRVDHATRIITTFAGSGPTGSGKGSFSGDGSAANSATLNFPGALALDNNGSLLIADTGNNRIRVVAPNTFFVSSGLLAFGPALLNTQSPSQNFSITNASNALLTFAISVTGEYVESDNCQNGVVPGSSCQVSTSFTPTTAGRRIGTIAVAPNSGNPISISLIGEAKSNTTVALRSSQNPQLVNQPVTFTATVAGESGAVTGAVAFTAAGKLLGISTLIGGEAALSTTLRTSSTVTAQYYGDLNNFPNISTALLQNMVYRSLTTLTVSSSMKPSIFGQAITLTATVKAGTVPDGALITFKRGVTVLAAIPLSGGSASFTTSALPPGVNVIVVSYAGDPFFYPATAVFLQTVEKVPTTTALSTSANPARYGQPLTFMTTVVASGNCTFSGYVIFRNGVTILGAAVVGFSGTASLTRSTFPLGTLALTATYLGNAQCGGSTSAELDQAVVLQAQLTASPASIDFGSVAAANSTVRSVLLTNVGNASATITQLSNAGTAFSLEGLILPFTLRSGASVPIQVTYTPPLAGAYSDTAMIKSDAVNPQLPIALSGTATHSVDISWTDIDATFFGHNIYRGTQQGGPYTRVNPWPIWGLNWNDANVQPGTTYYYVVTAVSFFGMESEHSDEASAIVPEP